MPLCKPNSAVFKAGWKEVDRSQYCVMEKRGECLFLVFFSPPQTTILKLTCCFFFPNPFHHIIISDVEDCNNQPTSYHRNIQCQ